jgi:hypothetical protein
MEKRGSMKPAPGHDKVVAASDCGRVPLSDPRYAREACRGENVPSQFPAGPPNRAAPDTKKPGPRAAKRIRADGARGTRTPDLLGAIQALSQLSYSPGRSEQGFPPAG